MLTRLQYYLFKLQKNQTSQLADHGTPIWSKNTSKKKSFDFFFFSNLPFWFEIALPVQ
jgi:hypothetical protein